MMKNGLLALDAGSVGIILVVVAVLIVIMLLLMLMTRVKTCPPDKVLVVYGKNRKNNDGTYRSSKCVHALSVCTAESRLSCLLCRNILISTSRRCLSAWI